MIETKADAADAATGGRGNGWRDWWGRGDDMLRDMDDWGRRMREGRGGEWEGRMRSGFRDFDDHLRRWDRRWDGWDNRFGPVFDDWGRRWGMMRDRFDSRDWGRGNWRGSGGHESAFRQLWGDFDNFRGHWGRMRDDWGRRMGWDRDWDDRRRVYRDGFYRAPGTELGGWR